MPFSASSGAKPEDAIQTHQRLGHPRESKVAAERLAEYLD